MKARLTILRYRLFCLMAMVAMFSLPFYGQDDEMMHHFSLSGGVGTTGITLDVGTMLGNKIGLRGGIDYMPKFKYSTDLTLALVNRTKEVDISKIPDYKVNVTGTLNNTTGHVLLDIYPSEERGFHVTLGAYLGKNKVVDVVNEDSELLKQVADFNARRGEFADIPISYGLVAAKLGDYNIMPDDNGNARAYMRVRKVRPYLGVGWGRTVPDEKGVKFLFDVGLQFSGKPRVYNGVNGQELTAEGVRGEDGGILKTVTGISLYPVLSFRIVGRLF